MSEYIHKDDAYEWLREKQIEFAENDFAKVQAERDAFKAKVVWLQTDILLLERRITELQTELKRLETEYARGL
jgi:predicted  nucleic acid-binding Zn-ribbon protein